MASQVSLTAGYLSKTIGISCVFGKLRVLSRLLYVSLSNFFLSWWSDSRSARSKFVTMLRGDAVCLVACWTQAKATNFSCLNFSHIRSIYKLKMQSDERGDATKVYYSSGKLHFWLKRWMSLQLTWRASSQGHFCFPSRNVSSDRLVVPTAKRMLHSLNFPINQTRNQSITSFMVDGVKRRRRLWWRWRRRSWRRYQNFS